MPEYASEAENCQVCMWIVERRFPEDYWKHEYRKINAVSENKNENVELIINDVNEIRTEILAKFVLVRERHKSPTSQILKS